VTLTGLVILILIVTHLSSIYYGIYLNKYGQSITLKQWASSLVRDKFRFIPNYVSGLFANPPHIYIDIKFKHFQKIAYKRQTALQQGSLMASPNDWVPARIRYKGKTYKCSIRLKGDTPDHWKRLDRWSFKIKLKDNKTLFGMKRFAIQDPRTRFYLNEWYFHKLLEYSGLIHLRYDFIKVTINGKEQSIYAIEENFEKRLIENNNHREGPIIKFASGYNWGNKLGLFPIFRGASIDVYQENKILQDDNLSDQYRVARNLLEGFRRNKLPVSKVFDVDKLAKFFALCDLLGNDHAAGLGNLKFYYNPITSLIEPVGYDYNQFFLIKENGHGLLGAQRKLELGSSIDELPARFDEALFKDVEFFKAYIAYLEEISEKQFLDNFFNHAREEAKEKLRILHSSYPEYNFHGKSILLKNQKYIKDYLSPQKCLQAYYNNFSSANNLLTLNIHNIYAMPVEVVDVIYNESIIFKPMQQIQLQAAIESEVIQNAEIKLKAPSSFKWSDSMISGLSIRYRILGTEKVLKAAVDSWPYPDDHFVNSNFLRQPPNFKDFEFLIVNEDTKEIFFESGDWNLARPLIIPSGYNVIAHENLKLDMLNSAFILSYSPILFMGSDEHPILVHSSDSTGQGIIIINAHGESLLNYVSFVNLSNPSRNGWALTGAVTFYESPVKISNCKFSNNRSEDALNIIRSNTEILNSLFSNSRSDAFDGDFINGKIVNTSFAGSGNDAVDVSGSVLKIRNIFINGAGDKGLSAGENSRVHADQIEIKNAEIGVASKDNSELKIKNFKLNKVRVGIAVYQKKSEFGPALIQAENLQSVDVQVPYLLEKDSNLTIDSKVVKPNGNNILNILYPNE
jgi:hypothetical protein